jgi:hypothetical protein
MGIMTHDQFDERLRESARDYHAPPPTPRDAMWAAIAARRAAPRRDGRPWMRWGVGVAAVLVLGIAIGRYTAVTDQPAEQAAAPVRPEPVAPGGAVYQVAAAQYLSRADAFLTGFRADAERGQLDSSFSGSARDLLVSTRLMLDSPAGNDPRLRSLLEDLELVLAQIAQYRAGEDAQFIDQGLDHRGVLLRLRAAIPAGSGVPNPSGGVL